MSLLVLSTNTTSAMDRLTPSWIRRSRSAGDTSAQNPDLRPKTSNGLLSPRPTDSTSNSDESRSSQSIKNSRRGSVRGLVNRLRSSSSASSLGGKAQEVDVNDIHDWFRGFQRYNQLIATMVEPQELAKASKALTKNCGGGFIHGLSEATFDFSLLWCPASKLSQRNTNEPSWSWKAFNSPVNFPFDPTTCPDIYRIPKEEGDLFRSEVIQYHIGPQATPYTVRREKKDSLRIKYPPYFHAPRGSDPSIESNTLRFTTTAISADDFTAEQLHYQDKEIPCSQLVNAKSQHCGVIMDFEASISEPCATGPFEFILLSRNLRHEPTSHARRPANSIMHPPGTPIWDGERFVWDEEVVEADETAFESGEWKMLNVMLVKWIGDYAERVAIARIHEDEWLARKPARKEIVLR